MALEGENQGRSGKKKKKKREYSLDLVPRGRDARDRNLPAGYVLSPFFHEEAEASKAMW